MGVGATGPKCGLNLANMIPPLPYCMSLTGRAPRCRVSASRLHRAHQSRPLCCAVRTFATGNNLFNVIGRGVDAALITAGRRTVRIFGLQCGEGTGHVESVMGSLDHQFDLVGCWPSDV